MTQNRGTAQLADGLAADSGDLVVRTSAATATGAATVAEAATATGLP